MKEKIVVVCGSMRFLRRMQEISEKLELENGWTVIGVNPHVLKTPLTERDIQLLNEIHLRKIALSDAIYVVNADGYIGESVKKEIEFAKANGKEILYLENI